MNLLKKTGFSMVGLGKVENRCSNCTGIRCENCKEIWRTSGGRTITVPLGYYVCKETISKEDLYKLCGSASGPEPLFEFFGTEKEVVDKIEEMMLAATHEFDRIRLVSRTG